MKKFQVICLFCFELIEPGNGILHGNAKYCCESHAYREKLKRQKKKYASLRQLRSIEKNHAILIKLYNHFPDHLIHREIFESMGFDWSLITGSETRDGYPLRCIHNYGYVVFIDDKIKIYKL